MVERWAADVVSERDSLLLVYRRDNVTALNQAARHAYQQLGRLDGPELEASGQVFQAGDRIITPTPGPDRAWTTSQRATVTAVDLETLTPVTSRSWPTCSPAGAAGPTIRPEGSPAPTTPPASRWNWPKNAPTPRGWDGGTGAGPAKTSKTARQAFDRARDAWIEHGADIAGRFTERIDHLARQIDQLEQHQHERHAYLEQHPDLVQQIGDLGQAISRADELERHHRHERELRRLDLGHSSAMTTDSTTAPTPKLIKQLRR